ncbi:MAG: tRNA (adenosine(37)-N6)-threonylcarbamoyltransferase complex dimerization subunit type 1 TsaB [Candidatus Binataceae bacterium]
MSVEPLLRAGAKAGPVLGLDTGAPLLSVGIVTGGRIRASATRLGRSHGAALPEAVDEVLEAAGLKVRELAAVAVAIGPGSFTGLRIGLSYAKGLVLGARLAIVGVPTLDSMALCAVAAGKVPAGALICPVLDARKGEVYTSLYRPVGDALEKMTEDLVVSLVNFARQITGEVVFVGNAKAEEGRLLRARLGMRATIVGDIELRMKGSFVATLGAARVARNDLDDAVTLEPRYVRASEGLSNPPP